MVLPQPKCSSSQRFLPVENPSYDGHKFSFVQHGSGRLSGKAIPTIGYRGIHAFDLTFENFFVPNANVIGGEAGLGKGLNFAMADMMGGRMQTAAACSCTGSTQPMVSC